MQIIIEIFGIILALLLMYAIIQKVSAIDSSKEKKENNISGNQEKNKDILLNNQKNLNEDIELIKKKY